MIAVVPATVAGVVGETCPDPPDGVVTPEAPPTMGTHWSLTFILFVGHTQKPSVQTDPR